MFSLLVQCFLSLAIIISLFLILYFFLLFCLYVFISQNSIFFYVFLHLLSLFYLHLGISYSISNSLLFLSQLLASICLCLKLCLPAGWSLWLSLSGSLVFASAWMFLFVSYCQNGYFSSYFHSIILSVLLSLSVYIFHSTIFFAKQKYSILYENNFRKMFPLLLKPSLSNKFWGIRFDCFWKSFFSFCISISLRFYFAATFRLVFFR